jgi:hypothetical protein
MSPDQSSPPAVYRSSWRRQGTLTSPFPPRLARWRRRQQNKSSTALGGEDDDLEWIDRDPHIVLVGDGRSLAELSDDELPVPRTDVM